MFYSLIFNPVAGNGKAQKSLAAIKKAINETSLHTRLFSSEGPGHAVELAEKAALTSNAVIAIGGDGTVHEVSRGIINSKKDVSLGVIPVGTGNDFVKMLGMSSDPRRAVLQILTAESCPVDYGRVRWWEGSNVKEDIFVNAVGTGFDAVAADEVKKYKSVSGVMAYLLAVLSTLTKWQAPNADVTITSDEQIENAAFTSSMFLVTAGNGISSGGGFYLTPDASIDDGKLDICFISDLTIPRVLSLIPRALRGKHVGASEVTIVRGRGMSVESRSALSIHADGEVLSRVSKRMEVEVIPGGLSVLMPLNRSLYLARKE